MSESDLLAFTPGMIGMKCPVCRKGRLARRQVIDPPGARLLFFPCSEECATQAHIDEVIYTDANRQVIPL